MKQFKIEKECSTKCTLSASYSHLPSHLEQTEDYALGLCRDSLYWQGKYSWNNGHTRVAGQSFLLKLLDKGSPRSMSETWKIIIAHETPLSVYWDNWLYVSLSAKCSCSSSELCKLLVRTALRAPLFARLLREAWTGFLMLPFQVTFPYCRWSPPRLKVKI